MKAVPGVILAAFGLLATAQATEFERIVIDPDFPGAYQVEVADINGDGKPDIVALGGDTCAWYENPSWKKRIITGPDRAPGVISSAARDVDGDGWAEVAIAYDFAMNEPLKGKLGLASRGSDPDGPWEFRPIADIGSIHRLRWGNIQPGDEFPELIVAPIFGPDSKPPTYQQSRAAIRSLSGLQPGVEAGPVVAEIVAERPIIHAIRVVDVDGDGIDDILTADNLGVSLLERDVNVNTNTDPSKRWRGRVLVSGAAGEAPARGCSEIHLGKGSGGGRFLATVEPWHGTTVAVYRESGRGSLQFGGRTILDDRLHDGHALWVADVDGDGADEVFAGHRGRNHGVSMYRFQPENDAWDRAVLDRDIAAQDLRGADLDGDGVPDIVAVGGATHNVVWYRPIRRR